MPSLPWTILKIIRWTEERFKKEGIPCARLEAEVLLAENLGMDRVGLYIHYDQPLTSTELNSFKEMVSRRLKREPLAYIIGKKEFWSMSFKVTPDVFIPRPETEMLVEEALKIATRESDHNNPLKILDIGTGSGAIVIALAKELPTAYLEATEISAKALEVARENAAAHGVAGRIDFKQADLFPSLRGPYDLIVANPPYIPRRHLTSLPPEVRHFEPPLAWDGGEDGLDFFRRLLPQVGKFLRPQGWFLTEIGVGQEEEIKKIAGEMVDLSPGTFVKDLAGVNRVFKVSRVR
ncbi:MAG: peptide chain release factor N(5)-glutamine methyltransferase [Thermodesulfobacteriota bacterium]